ncbi:hypothetical protein GX51_01169 [Blastomyces parvus]|uniref:F-box domain-containing protein n=1 Tax=Blastomyces parvus TaxID=2060905 RepID=A0A2B7XHU8_9EURO|nr:hypothetical protein GX51_01169 [Blastomyces parvus]
MPAQFIQAEIGPSRFHSQPNGISMRCLSSPGAFSTHPRDWDCPALRHIMLRAAISDEAHLQGFPCEAFALFTGRCIERLAQKPRRVFIELVTTPCVHPPRRNRVSTHRMGSTGMPQGIRRSKRLQQPKKIPPQCSALTPSYDACKKRALLLRTRGGGLPVCWTHRKLGLTVAFCQATLGDNRKCLKEIPWTEVQLCFEHIDFPLPCYILRLPIELRQQIFSYILDEYQRSIPRDRRYRSFLEIAHMNRQIYEDATYVLYQNAVCEISLWGKNAYILGIKCYSIQPGSWQKFKQISFGFHISENYAPPLEDVQLLASHLRDSNLTKLHIGLSSFLFWKQDTHSVDLLRNSLVLYLNPFRQLTRVRESSVVLNTMVEGPNEIERWMKYMSSDTKAMAIAMEWRRYYEEWTENLKREAS